MRARTCFRAFFLVLLATVNVAGAHRCFDSYLPHAPYLGQRPLLIFMVFQVSELGVCAMLEMFLMFAGLMLIAAGILFVIFIYDIGKSGRVNHEEKFDGRSTRRLDVVDDDL